MNKQPPIFIINLPQGIKRRSLLQQQLLQYKLNATFFAATDGALLKPGVSADFKIAQGEKLLSRKLAAGELGCILSHYFLLKKIVQESIPLAVILEDDAKITEDLTCLINNLHQVPSDWDLLHIGYWDTCSTFNSFVGRKTYPLSIWHRSKVKIPELNRLNISVAPLIDEVYGTHAYAVTTAGAQNLLQVIEQQPILPFDLFLHNNKPLLRHFAITPPLCWQNKSLGIEQHITTTRERVKRKNVPAPPQRLDKIRAMLSFLESKEHPLNGFYYALRHLRSSIINTKKVLMPPVMRKRP
ncbi:MAG: glycosyltransferase family 25 protein [Gammaproteobacteria bacterium]|nr:glycosyltransferase family 25 protein [Gammaproteobacteria bacterium]